MYARCRWRPTLESLHGAASLAHAAFSWPTEDGTALAVTLRWNQRRRTRMGFEFAPGGAVLVDAPPGTAVCDVQRLLRRHARWVLRRSRSATGAVGPTDYVDGASLLFRGRRITLRLRAAEIVRLADETTLLAPAEHTKAAVWAWWARQADVLLEAALRESARQLPWLPCLPPWRHRYMASRWGSCSSRGRVSLNTHLAKVPPTAVVYVTVHELCHLRHMDHGRRFYALLEASLPDWRERCRALRGYAALLREPPPAASSPVRRPTGARADSLARPVAVCRFAGNRIPATPASIGIAVPSTDRQAAARNGALARRP